MRKPITPPEILASNRKWKRQNKNKVKRYNKKWNRKNKRYFVEYFYKTHYDETVAKIARLEEKKKVVSAKYQRRINRLRAHLRKVDNAR